MTAPQPATPIMDAVCSELFHDGGPLLGAAGVCPEADAAKIAAKGRMMERDRARLISALNAVIAEVESLDDYSLSRDTETYKAQACWDDVMGTANGLLNELDAK